jgi:spore coat protein A
MKNDHFRWLAPLVRHRHTLAQTTLAAALLLAAALASAAQVTINPVKDNTIYQGTDPATGEVFEDNSCGAGAEVYAGTTNDGFNRRALLQFDIAGAVPAGSTINSVTLTTTINRSGDNQNATMTLRPLTRLWGEGTVDCGSIRGGGQGAPAGTGDATWLQAQFQQVNWTSPGADFGAVSASASVGFGNGNQGVWSSPAMAADVQNWLDAPAGNNGWVIVGDEARSSTTRRFWSRTGNTPPQLTIDFTPTGNVFACCFTSGNCTVTDQASCTGQGGTPDTNTSTCSPNPCPQPIGACCNQDESCSDSVDRTTCEAAGGVFQGESSACSDNSVNCGLEPFVDALPLPAVVQPVGVRPDGVPQYQITVSQERQQLHRDLPDTTVWTYNGTYPGPTIEATVGQPIEVQYVNNLPSGGNRGGHYLQVDECAHGPSYWQDTARTVSHLHGGHVPARFDGQPEYDIRPGEIDTYEYPNKQLPATLWYHDHALGITRLNVYMGLAGYYLLRDSFETGLGLPSGEYEVPAVIQDREFSADGTLFYPPTLQDAFFGDKVLVNGKVWPFHNVKQGKYRYRFLNGSQARVYKLRLENLANPGQLIPFTLIGTDGGLISAPTNLNTLTMAPAERFDVVIDFTAFPAGTQIVLRNDDTSVPRLQNVMKFVVQGTPGFTGTLPASLRAVAPIDPNGVPVRYFQLERVAEPCSGGEWQVESLDGPGGNITGRHWDDLTEFPILGQTEIWEFHNLSNMMHPMHVHLVQFQVLERRNGQGNLVPLDPWELNTWKDTVRVPPNGSVRVIMKFEDYPGKFPYHCHILDHEDHEMMRQFQATNDPANCNDNGVCEIGEDCVSCSDCGSVSGAACGNGLCEIGDGESFANCPADCAGKAKGGGAYSCGGTVDCSDPRCTSNGFYCRMMPRVPACCGDRLCEGQETAANCAVDCAQDTHEVPGVTCADGLDNDRDGLTDANDPDCQAPVCTRNAPGFTLGADKSITASGSAVYTLAVTNNDTPACPDTAFNLNLLSETGSTGRFLLPSLLSAPSVTVAPGASNTSVTLTVRGNGTGTGGDMLDSTVEVRDDSSHSGQQQTDTVRTTIQAAVNCSAITSKSACNAEPACQWKKNACVNR